MAGRKPSESITDAAADKAKEMAARAAKAAIGAAIRLFSKMLLCLASVLGAGAVIAVLAAAVAVVLFSGGKKGTDGGEAAYSGTFVVTEEAAYLWEYLTEDGYTDVQAAAILGNLQWESRLDFTSSSTKGKLTVRGIAQWTSYAGTNKLERYAARMGMDWGDPELQCMCISTTLRGTNPYCGWYETNMSRFYGVTKQDFWEGDLYDATMSFFCCFEDPEEYPDGCNSHGHASASGCLSVSFDCGNGHGRYPYAQAYFDYFTGAFEDEDGEEERDRDGEGPEGGMEIPLYLQGSYKGAAWGDTNLADSGCGPTSLAMVVSYLQDKTVTPADIIAWCGTSYLAATGSGYGSSWELFPAAAKHYGLGYRRVTDKGSVDTALLNGCPVIAREKAGSFFSARGHFIVLRGVTEDGHYLVNDPAAKYSVNREFTWSELDRPENFYMVFFNE